MSILVDILSWACLLLGGAFAIIGGIGVLRLPDFFTRLHAASIADTISAGLILLGLCLQAGWSLVTVKLILILVFFVFASPTAAHALARAALHANHKPFLADERETP
jgi:multicomponent Na+:H+ antiporter subunit G